MLSPLPCVLLLTSAAIMPQFLPSSILTRLPQSLFACPGDTAFLKSQPVLHSRSRYCLRQSKACCRHSRWSFVNVVAGQPAQDNIQLFRPVFNACFHKRSVFQIHHLPRNAKKSAHGVDGSYFMCALLRLWSLLFPVPQPGKKGFCPPLKLSYPVKFWGISVGACMVWPDCTGAAGAAWEAPGAWE